MKLKTVLPIEIDIDYRQAIDALIGKARAITQRPWHSLSYSDTDRKVYSSYKEVLLTDEEHEFVGCIIKLVHAKENYEHPLVY